MPDVVSPVRRLPALPRGLVGSLRTAARAVGFWLAVSLPIAYLPLAVLGPSVLADPTVLGAVVAANLLALVVGHGHEPAVGRTDRVD